LTLLPFAHWQQRTAAPLYDGLPLPQPPYRYVSPPPSLKSSNEPPLSAERTLAIRNAQVVAGTVSTGDNQATAFFPAGALSVPPGSQGVLVRLEPDGSPPAPPPGSSIRGNVYRLTALAQPSGAPAGVARPFQLTLRYPPGPFQEIQLYREQAWRPAKTSRDASNPYATALLSELGEVAATAPPEAKEPSFFSGLARIVEGYVVLAAVLAFALIAATQAIRRGRKRA
jgi:hypothetical protein